MAKIESAFRHFTLLLLCLVGGGSQIIVQAQPASVRMDMGQSVQARKPGHLTSSDIGLVVNEADPFSVEVGEYYAVRRRLKSSQVLHVRLPVRAVLTPGEFDDLRRRIERYFGAEVQALALAWTIPYAVQCNSVTGALALGFDPDLCENSCGRSRLSPYLNSSSSRPFSDHHLRPSMLLAARTVVSAKAMIDRGVAADGTLGRRGGPPAVAYFLKSEDAARNVRAPMFPLPGLLRDYNVDIKIEPAGAMRDGRRV
ncbi:MAG TPA: TIGR03790 family protein, partial [Burkholderiaceae bacterium]|nr:TIGR03790 family protein [Burkholderiaceae bacterium]